MNSTTMPTETETPPATCYYCDEAGHDDTPCPKRAFDAARYAAHGARLYPRVTWHGALEVVAPDGKCYEMVFEGYFPGIEVIRNGQAIIQHQVPAITERMVGQMRERFGAAAYFEAFTLSIGEKGVCA